tara:strand:- start:315 stop:1298 length:984 start_codon:yes stop_codon:yes gene_type:complete
MNYCNSLNSSLYNFLKKNKKSIILGEDLLDPYGGAFKVTKNLSSAFRKQVIDMPISESSIIGIGAGLAHSGHKVIAELMFGDFLTLTIDQIHNGISKSLELIDTKYFGSLTIRAPMGAYRGYGCTHSQSIETLLMNTPNINIFSPNIFINPGKLLSRVIEKEKLSLFIEHKVSYNKECEIKTYKNTDLIIENFDDYTIVKLFNETPEFSIITYGHVSELGLGAIYDHFIQNEINGELIVLNKINDIKSELFNNIKTNQILTLEESISNNGWGKMISNGIYKAKFNKLNKPIINIGSKSRIIPSSVEKEKLVLPSIAQIQKEIINLLN